MHQEHNEPENIVISEGEIVFTVGVSTINNTKNSVFLQVNAITMNGSRKFCICESEKEEIENEIILKTTTVHLKQHPLHSELSIIDNNKIGFNVNISLSNVKHIYCFFHCLMTSKIM